jgi:hypothetical protein
MSFVIGAIGAIGFLLLFLFSRNGKLAYARWGQACVILGFAIIAFVLIRAKSFWIGGAFAISALWQIGAITINIIRKRRCDEVVVTHDARNG